MATWHRQRSREGSETTGHLPLTPAERNLLCLTLLGQTPLQMAVALELSLPEVEAALAQLQRRVGVSSHRKLLVHVLIRGGYGVGR